MTAGLPDVLAAKTEGPGIIPIRVKLGEKFHIGATRNQAEGIPDTNLATAIRSIFDIGGHQQVLKELEGAEVLSQEVPILFMDKNSVLSEGRIDLLARRGKDYLVVDWKTDKLGSEEMKERYQDQMNFYLQGIRGVLGDGAKVTGLLANLRTGQVQEIL